MDKKMKEVVENCWEHFQNVKQNPFVVQQSIPILYFGDLDAYLQSELKIITVGSNPSDTEFSDANDRSAHRSRSFRRFRGAETIFDKKTLTEKEANIFIQTLNQYFKDKPYNWFTCYEPLLNGLGASYHKKGAFRKQNEPYRQEIYENIAIHTDIYSPLATNPVWGKLSSRQKNKLAAAGTLLWIDLINYLEPDVILLSYSSPDFQKIKRELYLEPLQCNGEKYMLYEYTKSGKQRRTSAYAELNYYQMKSGKKSLVVYGTKGMTPFGTITKKERYELGLKIKGEMFQFEDPKVKARKQESVSI